VLIFVDTFGNKKFGWRANRRLFLVFVCIHYRITRKTEHTQQ
jgi:hypothetical protein